MRPFAPLALLAALVLCQACSQEPPPSRLYRNEAASIRFHPAQGWTVAEKAEAGCAFAVEASLGPDLRFLICSSPPRPEILFTQNAFVSCENVKQYIEQALKGIRPTCANAGAGDHMGYEALYARLLNSGGGVRVQFVDHQFIPVRGRLVQVMAYAVGDDDKQARALFERHGAEFAAMMQSVRLY